jgi:hypothetical protein
LYRCRICDDPEPAGNKLPTLAEMQHFVGGYVEHVQVFVAGGEIHLFVNDDGRRIGLPLNDYISQLYGEPIAGNVWMWLGELPADA